MILRGFLGLWLGEWKLVSEGNGIYTNCSRDDPIIMSMDNHESHISVDMLQYAKNNGVHVITLPPDTSYKTEPLDRSVFGPLKRCYNAEFMDDKKPSALQSIRLKNLLCIMDTVRQPVEPCRSC